MYSDGTPFGAPPFGSVFGATPSKSSGSTSVPPSSFGFVPSAPEKKTDVNIEHARKNKKDLILKEKLPNGIITGEVFVFGSGECDQLGLGDILEKKKPFQVKQLRSVVEISTGCLHALALCSDGAVWSWGCNDEGVLGYRTTCNSEQIPRKIDFLDFSCDLDNLKMKKISAGGNHSASIDVTGRCWLWGSYKDGNGYCGFPDYTDKRRIKSVPWDGDIAPRSTIPKRVPGMVQCTLLTSGCDHTVVISKGSAYSWGSNACAQLGQGTMLPQQPVPGDDEVENKRRMTAFKEEKTGNLFPKSMIIPNNGKIKVLGAGDEATYLVMTNGKTYACGLNGDYQLGTGENGRVGGVVKEFQVVQDLSGHNVIEISGGKESGVALTDDGRVFSWGANVWSGMNAGEEGHFKEATEMSMAHFCNRKVIHVQAAAGGTHSLAVTEAGDLYTWGFGELFQLGNVPKDVNADPETLKKEQKKYDLTGPIESTPHLVTSKKLEGRIVLDAQGGSQHSCILVWDQTGGNKRPREGVPVEEPSAKRARVVICEPEIYAEICAALSQTPSSEKQQLLGVL